MAYLTDRPEAQGELLFWRVSPDHFADAALTDVNPEGGDFILAHSESGHHHVVTMERVALADVKQDAPGMAVLRMLVDNPEGVQVRNLNPAGHENLALSPGLYEVRKAREMGLDDVIRQSMD